jgi:NTE family protein
MSTKSAGAWLGLALGSIGEMRAGIRRSDTDAAPTSSHGSGAATYSHTDSGLDVSVTIDQIDNVNFPRRGVLAFIEAYDARPSLGSDDAYRRVDASIYAAATSGRHTVLGFLKATSALGGTLPAGQGRVLGGLFNLSGLPPGELIGSYGGVAGVLYLYRFGRLPAFGEGLYGGFSLETGNVWQTREAIDLGDLRRSGSLAIGADTMLGPVYLAYGVTSGGKDSYYLYVGRTF